MLCKPAAPIRTQHLTTWTCLSIYSTTTMLAFELPHLRLLLCNRIRSLLTGECHHHQPRNFKARWRLANFGVVPYLRLRFYGVVKCDFLCNMECSSVANMTTEDGWGIQ
ncbi:hypothetical protein M426DRAFT_180061 [Hypoxylon sp. CI-4A]|nr:hypothetical protein M426DRAFT_180061 [Hypoxylon sp. CI-4A]